MKKKLALIICIYCTSVLLFAQEYTTLSTIPYRKAGNAYALERCKLDFYYPKDSFNYATIVWFHSGGLTSGERYIPQQLKNSGIAVVAVDYRLLPKASLEHCIDDAAAAVAWAFKNVEKYGGSTKKIIVAGHSAGGYLISMIGLQKKWLNAYDVDADSIAVLSSFSGQSISHFAYRERKGMKPTQPSIDEFAPLYHVRADAPPLILISGDREMELFGRYEETAYFWRMMKENGHKACHLYELGGHNHGDMCVPAFHILKNYIRKICHNK
ncbi:MAG: alpha/beta hydrolase [Bacteroidales bacterium]